MSQTASHALPPATTSFSLVLAYSLRPIQFTRHTSFSTSTSIYIPSLQFRHASTYNNSSDNNTSSSLYPQHRIHGNDFSHTLARTVQKHLPKTWNRILLQRAGNEIARAVLRAADYTIDRRAVDDETIEEIAATGEHVGQGLSPLWHGRLALPPTYSSWASVIFLHLWILRTAHRALTEPAPKDMEVLAQSLQDAVFERLEEAMHVRHGLNSKAVRERQLRSIFEMYRGMCISLDEGLVKGDTALAAAVWRNVYKAKGVDADIAAEDGDHDFETPRGTGLWFGSGSREPIELGDGNYGQGWREDTVDPTQIALIVDYLRASLYEFDTASDGDIIFNAEMLFSRASVSVFGADIWCTLTPIALPLASKSTAPLRGHSEMKSKEK